MYFYCFDHYFSVVVAPVVVAVVVVVVVFVVDAGIISSI